MLRNTIQPMRPYLSATEVIDRDELMQRMMGSEAMAARVLEKFLKSESASCDLMESTVRIGDQKAFASVAHRHKGTAQTLAMPRVARLAAELEVCSHGGATSQLLEMVDQMRHLHQEVRDVLERGTD